MRKILRERSRNPNREVWESPSVLRRRGCQNIPEDVVRRRYERGRNNLMQLYLPLCDTWVIYNNSGDEPHLVAERPFNQQVIIYDSSIWQQITEAAHD